MQNQGHQTNCLGGRGIITNLPQPGTHVARPEKVAVQAQVAGHMVGKTESSDKRAPLVQNGVC